MELVDWLPLLLAPFIGSFLGVVVRRLPAGRPVVASRSACESCGTVLGPAELVPLLSHAVQGGRCRHCGAAIDPFHWQVELAATAVAAVALWLDPDRAWADCFFGWVLLALASIDWNTGRLPDVLTLPLVPAGLVLAWVEAPDLATDNAVAAAAGFVLFRLVSLLYRRLRGRDGMGAGDAKLLAAIGAWTGLEALPSVVLGAAVAGLGFALLLRMRGRRVTRTTSIPFGPCLALAGFAVRLHS